MQTTLYHRPHPFHAVMKEKLMRKFMAGVAFLAVGAATALAQQPKPIPPEQFDKLHQLIKPQGGELRFQEIPWHLSVWEARKQAAEQGKPILVWSGSGGAPVGVC
jgi:hypothetical protein